MNKTVIIILCTILLTMPFIIAEPTQQYNKLYLDPFYRASMNQNTNYTYTITVNPPDKITSVKSAIITIDAWISPTVTFNAWVNGQTCRNPTYTISTTYAGAGRGVATFDCTNIIKTTGNYTITIRPTGQNTGASTTWLDITYMNNPNGEIQVHGTEYIAGDLGRSFLQLLDANNQPITNATCMITGYYPDTTTWFNYTLMSTPLNNSDGLYFYDFTAPTGQGVYMLSAYCTVPRLNSTTWTDDFECNGLSCGSSNWNSSWAVSDNDVVTVTGQGINAYALSWKDTDNAQRNFTPGSCDAGESLFITFWAKAASDLDAGRNCVYEYYNGSTYVELLRINNTIGGFGQWRYSSTNVCSYSISNVTQSMRVSKTGGGAKLCYLDDVEIVKSERINGTEYHDLRGSGEVHVNEWFDAIPQSVWEYEPRNLTFYNNTPVDLSSVISLLNSISGVTNVTLGNVTLIYGDTQAILYALQNLNLSNITINITNLTEQINQSINEAVSQPSTYDTNTILLILFIAMIILSLFWNPAGYLMILGIYGIIYGIILMSNTEWWIGMIVIGISAIIGVAGYRKL